MSSRTHNKCDKCGSTKSKTFWDYDDNTSLCDKCHAKYGNKWQKEIDKSKNKSSGWKTFLIVLGGIFGILVLTLLIIGVMAYFGLLTTSSDSSGTGESTDLTIQPKEENNVVYTPPEEYCGDNLCNNGETCSTCSMDCGQCPVADLELSNYTFSSVENIEPYYSVYCDKINPYDLDVRKAAAKAIKNDPGSYSVKQLFDIYDWIKDNINYQNVPLSGVPYPPKETLYTESGDCKNQAVLIASMVEAIGGTAKVVADPDCVHAYTVVYFGSVDDDLDSFVQAVANHYGKNVKVNYFTNDDGIWVIFDPAGGNYPGNTLDDCTGKRIIYYVTSCLDCAQQYPDTPYTFGDSCYSKCPDGTISNNKYSCSPCPAGSHSFDNECVTCRDGYHLKTDGKCYPD